MAETAKLTKVKLLKPHTHAGVQFDADHEFEAETADAQWLINQKVAEAVAAPKSTTSVAKPNPSEDK